MILCMLAMQGSSIMNNYTLIWWQAKYVLNTLVPRVLQTHCISAHGTGRTPFTRSCTRCSVLPKLCLPSLCEYSIVHLSPVFIDDVVGAWSWMRWVTSCLRTCTMTRFATSSTRRCRSLTPRYARTPSETLQPNLTPSSPWAVS